MERQRPSVGAWSENKPGRELETQGFIKEKLKSIESDRTDVLYTLYDDYDKTVYAAWKVKTSLPLTEWFLGVVPSVELEGANSEDRLEIIARACTFKTIPEEVLPRMDELKAGNSFSLRLR